MAEHLEQNDAAAAAVRSACQQLADLLDFVLVTTHTKPEGFRPTIFTNYLVPTSGEAVGLFGGSRVDLICVVHMAAERFWEVLREKLELPEEHSMPDTVSGEFEFRLKDHGWRSPMPNLTLILRYCGVPSQCLTFPWEPGHGLRDDVDNWTALHDIEDALEVTLWLSRRNDQFEPEFRSLIARLTAWAVLNGTLALDENFGLLTQKCLIWMVYSFANERSCAYGHIKDAVAAVCAPALLDAPHGRLYLKATASGRNVAAHVSVEALERFKAVVERTCDSAAKTPRTASIHEAKQTFYQEHPVVIALYSECWTAPRQKHYSALLATAATSFQSALRAITNGELKANLWPSVHKDSQTASKICLGIYSSTRTHNTKTQDNQTMDAVMETVRDQCRWLAHEAFLGTQYLSPSQETRTESDTPQLPIISQLESTEYARPLVVDSDTRQDLSFPEKPKFLDAAKAISKLRWDPQWRNSEWEIGYEDRFDGLMWKNLEEWQAHTEEEDFIPTHRVRQMRLRGEQKAYWNRDKKESLL